MGKRSLYLPDELEARVQARAESEQRSFSNFIQWALTRALGSAQEGPGGIPSPPAQRAVVDRAPAPTRAPIFNRATSLGPSNPIPRRGK